MFYLIYRVLLSIETINPRQTQKSNYTTDMVYCVQRLYVLVNEDENKHMDIGRGVDEMAGVLMRW